MEERKDQQKRISGQQAGFEETTGGENAKKERGRGTEIKKFKERSGGLKSYKREKRKEEMDYK